MGQFPLRKLDCGDLAHANSGAVSLVDPTGEPQNKVAPDGVRLRQFNHQHSTKMNIQRSTGSAPANHLPSPFRRTIACCACILACLVLSFTLATAAELKEARVSEVVRDVKLLPQQAPARPAVVSDEVRNGTAVRTGVDSRAELTFTDQTLARLGSNTIFSFAEGTRNLQLGGGAMLLRVPKDAGGAQISTAAITAAITGTTVMLEYHPNAYSKFIVLEGTGRIFRPDRIGESVLVNAGQMMIVNPASRTLPNPVDVDIKRLMKTSSLVKKFRPLASNNLIDTEIGKQTKQKLKGGLIETNLVIFGGGTTVSLLDPTTSGILDQANANELRQPTPPPTPTPTTPPPPPVITPTPSKEGTPQVIATSYQIGNGTVINTDPSITTNGQTNYGKIYDPARDKMPLSQWLFGSTSDFDGQFHFDELISSLNFTPLAGFKFSELSLIGEPTIVIGDGNPDNLALVSVGDLTSGFPGGTLNTLAGLNSLLLATQNGSINLGPEITFANIPNLAIYARGSNGNLSLDSPIFGTINLALVAEQNLSTTGSLVTTQTYLFPSTLATGLNVLINAGQAITIGDDLRLTTQGGNVDAGGTISITAGTDFTVAGVAILNILHSDFGNIGAGGTISIQVPNGTFEADSDVALRIHNEAIQIGGGTFGDFDAGIFGTIGTLSTGSSFDSAIFNQGGTFEGSASIIFNFGDAKITGAATFRILNEDANNGFAGGVIGGNASISVGATGSFTAPSLLAEINNLGGFIGGQSSILFSTEGTLTTFHDATFEILEGTFNGSGGASISVSAGSFSVLGSLIASITGTSFDLDQVSVQATDDITVGNQLLVGGNVTAGGNISATNGMTVGGNLAAGNEITSDRSITAQSIVAGLVQTTAGDVTIDNHIGTATFGLMANTAMIGGNLVMMNAPTITPNGGSSDGTIGNTPFDFTLTASRIVSTGPTFPALVSNGDDASASFGHNNPGNGGTVTLTLAGGLTIGSTNDLASITANGGAFATGSTAGGDGGTITINSSNDVTLLDGNVTATSGALPSASSAILGSGGTVNITTSGAITVGSKIEVSSADVSGPTVRRSAKGGNINLTSTKTTSGAAITINNTGQLLALLDAAAPGPGGKITILASGSGGSSVNVNGTLTASKGTVDIRHTGLNGTVNVSDANGINNAILHGDVVKIGALGSNGILTIGRGTLTADDTLKLYGGNTNGQVRFVDNVTIGGQNFTIIAADTITINNGKVVTVTGAPADIYVGFNGPIPKANYTGFGGNNTTTGTFAGAGANRPQPIANAPPFDGTPGG
jgi:mannose-6-phosphate isomerase-like protein (cupin superfamily)